MPHSLTLNRATSVLALIAAMAVLSAPVKAQDQDTPLDLGTIVVVGTGLPTEIRDNPASVTAIDQVDIKRVPRSSVARILDQVPGVRVTQSGIERITIRGESSQRVAIMIDGQPLTDHTGYGTPILVSPSNIERIEVVRGSSSVISGNNAIGGVVNIITKRGGEKPFQGTVDLGYFSATDGKQGALSFGGSSGKVDYRLSWDKAEHGDVETPDGPLENSYTNTQDIAAFLGFRQDNHYFGVRAQDHDLAAGVWSGDPDFFIDLPKRDLRKYSAFYEGVDLTPWLRSLKIDAYKQEIDRAFINDLDVAMGPGMTMNILSTSDDLQETWGLNGQAELQLFAGHRMVLGFSYEDDGLVSDKYTRTTSPFAPFPSVTTRKSDASIRTLSLYGQHEAVLNDALTATIGARYYRVESDLHSDVVNGTARGKDSNSDSRWLGALGLVYKPSEDVALRANVSQGYKYPTLAQLYLETTAGGSGVTLGNPDLDPESSTTYEIGARIDHEALTFDGTVFYSDAQDYITTEAIGTSGNSTYVNINQAKTWGVEISAEYRSPLWNLRPYLEAEYLQREFTFANGYKTTDSGTPEFAGKIGLRRDWSLGGVIGEWDLNIAGEGQAKQRGSDGAVSDKADAYHTVNFGLTADITDQFSLSVVANNLLNENYQPIKQYQGSERNIAVMLSANF